MAEEKGDRQSREPLSDEGARDTAAVIGGDESTGGTGTGRRRRKGGRKGGDGAREQLMVPEAEFRSYYGRPVLKPPVWEDGIAYYFYLGGLSAGSALLAAGADLNGCFELRRGARVASVSALGLGTYYLIKDLGRPERFLHMLRVAKPTSPMSMGTWILAAYGPAIGLAASSEVLPEAVRGTALGKLISFAARPAGLAAAAIAPLVASYTATLISQTAVPAWHAAHRELPWIFTGSSAASAGGLGMMLATPDWTGPARYFAVYGGFVELLASQRLEHRLGTLIDAYRTGRAGRELRIAQVLTAAGTAGAFLIGRRSRLASTVCGAALMSAGVFERLGLFHAGVASAKNPAHTIEPQRQRLRDAAQHGSEEVPTADR